MENLIKKTILSIHHYGLKLLIFDHFKSKFWLSFEPWKNVIWAASWTPLDIKIYHSGPISRKVSHFIGKFALQNVVLEGAFTQIAL
jgi:hypothetical protein